MIIMCKLQKGHHSGSVKPSVSSMKRLSANNARRVQEYLADNFTQTIDIAQLASVAGVSPNYFITRFAGTFGMPPHRYLINLRLDLAEKLLVGGQVTIAEVANITGFSDQDHLATTMKRYRGKAPTELLLTR